MACLGMCQLGEQFDVTDQLMFGTDDYFPRAQQTAQAQAAIVKSGDRAKAKIGGIVEFAAWLKSSNPAVYEAVMQSRPDILMPEFALSGLGGLSANATAETAPSTDWGKTASDILGAITGIWTNKQLIDINIKRAELGQPMLTDIGAISPTVNVTLPASAEQKIADIGKVAVFGLLGLGALMMIGKRRR